MQKDKKAEILRRTALFSEMSAKTEARLLALPTTVHSAGSPLCVCGEDGTPPRLGIVLSGGVAVCGRSGGGSVLLNRLRAGDVFGAACVFQKAGEPVSRIRTERATEVLFIERETLESLLREDFFVMRAYIAFLSEKVYFLNRKIIAFTAPRSDAALAEYLLPRAADGEKIELNLSQAARVLGIGRTTLYRAIEALEAQGALRYDGHTLTVLDRALLCRAAKEETKTEK